MKTYIVTINDSANLTSQVLDYFESKEKAMELWDKLNFFIKDNAHKDIFVTLDEIEEEEGAE